MARPKPWLKLWVDSLLGLKSLDLSLAETGAWWKLYAFGHYLGQSGRLTRENNRPYALPAIMEALRVTRRADMATFQHMVDKQLDSGLLRWVGPILVITGYDDEQSRSPSAQKEAVRDRVQRWRAAQKQETVTGSALPDATPQPQGEAEVSENGNGEVTSVTALPSALSSVSALEDGGCKGEDKLPSVTEQALVAELSKCYEANIGQLSGTTRWLFDEFLEEYHGPVSWIADAFKEGVSYNHRSWAYIRKILITWQQEGRRDESHGKQTERVDTPERDPLAGARESGWKVRTVREHDGSEDGDAD